MARPAVINPFQLAFMLDAPEAQPSKLALVVSNSIPAPAPSLVEPDPKEVRARLKQAAKLRQVGESTIERAEQELKTPRLANTHRRASMAASSEKRWETERALGVTIINLANAIESGDAIHLAGVSTKAAVQTLGIALDVALGNNEDAGDMSAHILLNAQLPQPSWKYGGANIERAIVRLLAAGATESFIAELRASEDISPESFRTMIEILGPKETEYQLGWYNMTLQERAGRLKRAGISTTEQLKAALVEFALYRTARQGEDPLKKAMRALVGAKVGLDFFPTPPSVAAMMAVRAGIRPGHIVFEPSAGCGFLADAAVASGGTVQCLEISDDLRNILKLKGHELIGRDFNEFDVAPVFDRVLMNPPFSNRLDCDHIRKAFDCLAPGGVLVAIACEGTFCGSDKKATQFRAWLDELGAEVEKLPEGTFLDPTLPVRTGVSARLITIVKD